jgi:hypothetical protein
VLAEVFEELDEWVCARNVECALEGVLRLQPCEIRVLGQGALFELATGLTLQATSDVDVYANYSHAVEVQFRHLLKARHLALDPLGHEVWMPPETQYDPIYQGRFVTAKVARAEYVLISKAARAPEKNRALLAEYLAKGASPLFLELAERHRVNLEIFV